MPRIKTRDHMALRAHFSCPVVVVHRIESQSDPKREARRGRRIRDQTAELALPHDIACFGPEDHPKA